MVKFLIQTKGDDARLIDACKRINNNTVFNVLQIALETGIDVEIMAMDVCGDKVKLFKVLDTATYRKLGII